MRRSSPQAGYNLVMLMVLLTVLNIMIAASLPSWSSVIRREKEEELIFRGLQYAEAIRLFKNRFERDPVRLEELIEVQPRMIRKLWKDPMTEDGKWAMIPAQAPGQPLDQGGGNGLGGNGRGSGQGGKSDEEPPEGNEDQDQEGQGSGFGPKKGEIRSVPSRESAARAAGPRSSSSTARTTTTSGISPPTCSLGAPRTECPLRSRAFLPRCHRNRWELGRRSSAPAGSAARSPGSCRTPRDRASRRTSTGIPGPGEARMGAGKTPGSPPDERSCG